MSTNHGQKLTEEELARQHLVDVLEPQICDWLRANDINPNVIPRLAVPKIDGGQIHTEIYLSNDNGRRFIDPDTGDAAKDHVSVPLKQAPPAVLNEWLGITG